VLHATVEFTMTEVQKLAEFVANASWETISSGARKQLKIRVLDSLACAIGAQEGEPVRKTRAFVDEVDGHGRCHLIGGGVAAPDRAALYNGALVRYLDFNDSYLAKGVYAFSAAHQAPRQLRVH
jgi:2-methylcitrate dehydratase